MNRIVGFSGKKSNDPTRTVLSVRSSEITATNTLSFALENSAKHLSKMPKKTAAVPNKLT